MSERDRSPIVERIIRILRLMAATSVIVALTAVVATLNGNLEGNSQTLISVAVALGACALVGMALLTFAYAYRQKEKNDRRP